MFFPIPILMPLAGGGSSKQLAKEIDTFEIVGSIYFLILFALTAGNVILAWFNISPVCASHRNEPCDVAITGLATAISTVGVLMTITLLFLSVRRLARVLRPAVTNDNHQ